MAKGFDWSFGPGNSPVMGAINAAGTTAGASMVGSLAGMPPTWALAGGVAAAGIAGISSAMQQAPGMVAGYRAACWLGASSWATYALATYNEAHAIGSGPWSWGALTALGVGAGIAGTVGTFLRSLTRSPSAPRVRTGNVKEGWQERIRRVGHLPHATVVAGPEWWPGRFGFTLDIDLGPGGPTWKDLAARTSAMESDAHLPIGCGIEVSRGIYANRAIMRVAVADALAEERAFPTELPMATVNNPLVIGWFQDGTPAEINMRWTSGVMAGQKGSGKTNTLHAITGRLAQCTDSLLFMIAIAKKGALAEPWNRAYLEGRADHPIIDRVAVTEEQAFTLCDILDDLIDQRIEKLTARMRAADDDKIPVGYSGADDLFIPEALLIVDEFAQLSPKLQGRITAIAEKGRGSSVATFAASQRAISDHIPPSLKKQSTVRIGMKVDDPEELSYLMGWSKKINVDGLTHEGTGLLGDGDGAIRRMRIFRMTPSVIDKIAVTCGADGRRPGLEPGMLSPAMQAAYDNWEHSGTPAVMHRPTHAAAASVKEITQKAQGLAERLRAQAEAIKAERQAPDAAEIAALEEMWNLPAAQAPQPAVDERARALEILRDAGPEGSGSTQIAAQLRAEGYKTVRQTVAGWLAEELIKGTVEQPGGKGKPYVWRG